MIRIGLTRGARDVSGRIAHASLTGEAASSKAALAPQNARKLTEWDDFVEGIQTALTWTSSSGEQFKKQTLPVGAWHAMPQKDALAFSRAYLELVRGVLLCHTQSQKHAVHLLNHHLDISILSLRSWPKTLRKIPRALAVRSHLLSCEPLGTPSGIGCNEGPWAQPLTAYWIVELVLKK